jgi:primase-polymerase (primpol)-like protein
MASPNNPATFSNFEACAEAVQEGRFIGLGPLMIAGSGIVGLDVDHAKETLARFPAVAEAIVAYVKAGGYGEASPSRTGLRLFALGNRTGDLKKRYGLEMYSDLRFLTATGHLLTVGGRA